MKNRKGLPHYTQIILLIFIMTVTVLGVMPVLKFTSQRFAQLKDNVISQLEGLTGLSITYERISPSLLRFVDIRGLQFTNPRSNDPVITLNRVKVYYSFYALIQRDWAQIIDEVSLENTQLELDWERDQEIIEAFFPDKEGGRDSGGSFNLPDLPAGLLISGRNLGVSLKQKNQELDVSDIFFRIEDRGDTYRASIRGFFQYINGQDNGFQVNSFIETIGSIGKDLQWASLNLELSQFDSSHFGLSQQNLYLEFSDNVVKAQKIQDKLPLDIKGEFNVETQDYQFDLLTEKLDSTQFITFSGPLDFLSPYELRETTVSLALRGNLLREEMNYKLNGATVIDLRPFQGDSRLNIALAGTPDQTQFEQLSIQSPRGNIRYQGSVDWALQQPEGIAHVQSFELPGLNKRLDTSVLFTPQTSRALEIRSDYIFLGTSVFTDAQFTFNNENDHYYLNGELKVPSPTQDSLISLDVTLPKGTDSEILASADIQDLPLSEIYKLAVSDRDFNLTQFETLNTYQFNTSLFAQYSPQDFLVNGIKNTIYDTQKEQNLLEANYFITDSQISINRLTIRLLGEELKGEVSGIRDNEAYSLNSSLQWMDDRYTFQGELNPGNYLHLSGLYDTMVYWRRGEQNYQEFSLVTQGFPVNIQNNYLSLTIDALGTLSEGNLDLIANRFALKAQSPYLNSDISLEASGRLKDNQITLAQVLFTDNRGTLRGRGDFTLEPEGYPFVNGQVDLASTESEESLSLLVEGSGTTSSLDLLITDIPLNRFLSDNWLGRIDTRVTAKGAIEDVEVEATLLGSQLSYNDEPIRLNLSGKYSKGKAELFPSQLSYNNLNLEELSASWDWNTGFGYLNSRLFAQLGKDTFSTRIEGEMNWDSQFSIRESFYLGNIHLQDLLYKGQEYPDWDITLETLSSNEVVFFRGGPNNALEGRISPGPDVEFQLKDSLPISLQGRADFNDEGINTTLRNIQVNLARLVDVLNPQDFDISEGTLWGDIKIQGAVNDPDFFGSLTLSDFTGSFPYVEGALSLEETKIDLSEKNLTIKRTTGNFSQGILSLSGESNFDHWVPGNYALYISIPNNPGIPFSFKRPILDIQGSLKGDISMEGDFNEAIIQGQMEINNTEFVLGFTDAERSEPSNKKPSKSDFQVLLQLSLSIGSRVQVYAPSKNLPILKGFITQGDNVDFYLNQQSGDYALQGEVSFDRGQINYLKSRSFYIKEGSLLLNESNQLFDPQLTVRAETKEKDNNGDSYTISLIHSGSLFDFQPRFESTPPKSEAQLMALMGLPTLNEEGNLLTEDDDTTVLSELSAAEVGADLVGDTIGIFILRPFEARVQEALQLDLFTFRSELIKKAILERDQLTSVQDVLDNTRVFFGKYLSDDIFLETILSLRSLQDGTGFGEDQGTIGLDLTMGLTFETPIFQIGWNINPQPDDQKSLFLKDNTFTLEWKKSF